MWSPDHLFPFSLTHITYAPSMTTVLPKWYKCSSALLFVLLKLGARFYLFSLWLLEWHWDNLCDCPTASEVTLKNIGNRSNNCELIIQPQQNNAKQKCEHMYAFTIDTYQWHIHSPAWSYECSSMYAFIRLCTRRSSHGYTHMFSQVCMYYAFMHICAYISYIKYTSQRYNS